MPIAYREAMVSDAEAMGLARDRGGWLGGAAAITMARYLAGEHSPQHAQAPRIGFVAEQDSQVVGFVAGHLSRRFGCEGELQWIFVLPEHRGAGVAASLLRRLAEWFLAQSARRICVNVEPDNTRARAFYARCGAQNLSEYWMEWADIAAAQEATVV